MSGRSVLPTGSGVLQPNAQMVISRLAAGAYAFLFAFAGVLSAQSAPRREGIDWGHGGVCYEIFVRSFYDSDGDGIGERRGLTSKLDYINDGNPATHTCMQMDSGSMPWDIFSSPEIP